MRIPTGRAAQSPQQAHKHSTPPLCYLCTVHSVACAPVALAVTMYSTGSKSPVWSMAASLREEEQQQQPGSLLASWGKMGGGEEDGEGTSFQNSFRRAGQRIKHIVQL